MSSPKKSKKSKPIALAIVSVLVIGGAFWLRKEANGFHNAISYNYWHERFTGVETYKADIQYFTRGSRDHKDVCFTFDDGPHEAAAPLILDNLKKAGVHATFFVVGIRVKEHPELVKRMIDEGHEVGNHTQDHIRLDTLPLKNQRAEIENCAINIERACGRRPALLRPPGMRFKHETLIMAKELGYTTVGWNVGAKDFIVKITPKVSQELKDDANTTSDQVADRVLKNVKPGVIILLHDNPVTAKALPTIFERLRKEGYAIKTVTQMLAELDPPVIIDPNPLYVPPIDGPDPTKKAVHVKPKAVPAAKA